jgi:hypothetical protein
VSAWSRGTIRALSASDEPAASIQVEIRTFSAATGPELPTVSWNSTRASSPLTPARTGRMVRSSSGRPPGTTGVTTGAAAASGTASPGTVATGGRS